MQKHLPSKTWTDSYSACPRVYPLVHRPRLKACSACPRVGLAILWSVGLACVLVSGGCSLASHNSLLSHKKQCLSQSPVPQSPVPCESAPRLGLGAAPVPYLQQPASIQSSSPRAFLPAGSYNYAPHSPSSARTRCSCGADHASNSLGDSFNDTSSHDIGIATAATDRSVCLDPQSDHQPKLRESLVIPGLGSKHSQTPPEPARFHPVPTRPVFEPLAHY